MAKILTAAFAKKVKPDSKRQEIPDGGLPGLYLVVQPSGSKSWAVRYRYDRKSKKMTLGGFPVTGLAEARAKAREALSAVSEGDDPASTKRNRRKADTMSTLVADFMSRHGSKRKSAAETQRIFDREILPAWGGRKAESITKRDVLDLLDGIVDRGAPYMANRTLAAMRKCFNWGMERDVLAASPCAGVKAPTEERKRDRVLTDDEVRAFWIATGRIGFPFGPLFRLLLLTGCRRDEVGGMLWRELDSNVWSIPGERTKNGLPLQVHLTEPALAELATVPRIKGATHVFTTNGRTSVSGFSRAKTNLAGLMLSELRRAAEARGDDPCEVALDHWKLHDLRRTMSTGMARLRIGFDVREACLNHIIGGVSGIYNRYNYWDEKKDAWQQWASRVRDVVGRPAASCSVCHTIT